MTQPNDKPRRWWIAPKLIDPIDPVEASYFYAYDEPGDPNRLEVEVVEASAFEAKCAELEEAYKDRNHWRGIYMGSPTSSLHRMIDKHRAEVERLRVLLRDSFKVLGDFTYSDDEYDSWPNNCVIDLRSKIEEAIAADAGKKGGSGE